MKKLLFLLILSAFSLTTVNAQESDSVSVSNTDQSAEFPGGRKAMLKFFAENVVYPEEALKQDIQLDAEAVRVVKQMPKWNPEMMDGKPMSVTQTIPVVFKTDSALMVNQFVLERGDKLPEFPGGLNACLKFISVNLKYPAEAARRKIYGRVVVNFVVGIDGSITNVNVAKSVHYMLAEEAIRVVKKMPKWNPGIMNGKPVRVKYSLPITFRLPASLSAR